MFALVAILSAATAFAGQDAPAKKAGGKVYAHFTTSLGKFTVELFEKDAPKTVANFVGLADGTKEWTDPKTGAKVKKPFYNGLIFHRVIADFMIQGGDPLGTGTGDPGYKFADEFGSGRKMDKAGVLAMANAGPNTNGSQFFITLKETNYLNGKHTVFGEVTEGMDTIRKIGETKTTKPGDRPVTPVVIQTVTIERK
jgi:Peptidyl-prolyl cis-trans isomerase (rotamase) - cyclophilin family